ncbi:MULTISPECIES: LCP family protein [unclassified Clostridium]|jgi:LCP family protein required for cell wall assembly|uniref:LCP family protein n=1 Tax=unclassified Clostridium TaxID=2614128 RepID=UPI001C8B3DAB|nr:MULTISPECIES: LCP family protein [unclassified Clostridium]MBX9136428.1 LCP family protein [Clostridium sp. K12(2020)]MBX9143301.1 LCP family protein [Clostridium sp. K13]MDU2291853.1 LCP family protein [Clostridium celatum]MDU4326456.1 LCP family protein [Clostridium celatum]
MKKRSKVVLWILGVVISILLVTIGGIYSYGNHLFNKIEKIEIDKSDVGIKDEVEEKLSAYSDSVINIALFGIDAEDGGVGRSDSIIIATIDTTHKKLKLTSIMRDSYVTIEGHGDDKINHAYAFGGPQLAIKTLNENFDLNIDDFVAVNFTTLPKIIDMLGGVTIDITSEEVSHIPGIDAAGTYTLTGEQALAYSRIRYASGGDYVRTDRQRTVLSKVFEKVLSINFTQYPSLLSEILPMVQTNLDYSEILNLGNEVLKMGVTTLEQERFPRDGYCEGKMIDKIYYLTFDKENTVQQLHDYIFEDIKNW